MHIEPGLVDPAKMTLAYATAAGAGAYTAKLAWDTLREHGAISLFLRAAISTLAVFCFFQVLPHYPVGISEVHFILGSTLLLLLGAAPAAIGLTLGLLAQGVLFAPFDLPQFFANITTLLVPLFAIKAVAERIIPAATPYVDVSYKQLFLLSTTYQGGVVAWVAFWAFYGQGFEAQNLASVGIFGSAYMLVVLIEPLADMALLAAAKSMRGLKRTGIFAPRLFN